MSSEPPSAHPLGYGSHPCLVSPCAQHRAQKPCALHHLVLKGRNHHHLKKKKKKKTETQAVAWDKDRPSERQRWDSNPGPAPKDALYAIVGKYDPLRGSEGVPELLVSRVKFYFFGFDIERKAVVMWWPDTW